MPRKKIVKQIQMPITKVKTNIEIETETSIEIEDKLTYDEFIPKHPKRKDIYTKFYALLVLYYNKSVEMNYKYDFTNDLLQKMALNIEKGIFNYTLQNNKVQDWNSIFQTYYIDNCVRVYSNLNPESYLKNINFIHRLFSIEFKPEELAYFDAEKRFPERHSQMMDDYQASLPKYAEKQEQPDGLHKCGYCASQKKEAYKTTYYQLQTRSAKIIGWKSTLLITSWLCYWKNSCSPSLMLKC